MADNDKESDNKDKESMDAYNKRVSDNYKKAGFDSLGGNVLTTAQIKAKKNKAASQNKLNKLYPSNSNPVDSSDDDN